MNKDNYRIFCIDKSYTGTKFHGDRKTVETFYASDRDAAYAHLLKYRQAYPDVDCYYEHIDIYEYVDRKGIKHETTSVFDDLHLRDNDQPLIAKIYDCIAIELTYWLVDMPRRCWHWLRDLAYIIKTRHNYNERWNLDCHILDDLQWNVKLLLKHRNGISLEYLDEARITLHKDDASFDLNAYNHKHYDYTDEEEKLAIEFQNKHYEELLRHIRAYNYYRYDGWLDDDAEAKALDAELHSTLPIFPGTYDSMDYAKLNELIVAEWNAIWTWMAKHGSGLWD